VAATSSLLLSAGFPVVVRTGSPSSAKLKKGKSNHQANQQIRPIQKNARKARGHRQNTATAQKKKKLPVLLRQLLAIPHHTVVRSG
jgi:hypothetical protein